MFSEKENVLHAGSQLQPGRAGATKLPPKTPMQQASKAPKTPFRLPLDRENMETAKKGLTVKKSAFQLDPSAFITPIGTRRIPLGGKTTNAKAPISEQKEKLQLKLSQSPVTKTVIRSTEEETPEIEYMPPRGIDLPDIPDDHIELDYEFIRKNMFTNVYSYYLDGRDEDGKTKMDREFDARAEQIQKEMIAEADGIYLPKKTTSRKTIPVRRDPQGASGKTTSRPTSRVGSQATAYMGKNASSSGPRPKTPSSGPRPPTTTKQTNNSTSRPTSRVETTSRPTSRASTTSAAGPSRTSTSRPTSAASTTSRYGLPGTSKPATKPIAIKGKLQPTKSEPRVPAAAKPLIDEEEEALRDLLYGDMPGDSFDEERLDFDDIKFDGDDFVFQF